MRAVVIVPILAALWFPFAETPQPAPTLKPNVRLVQIGPADPAQPNRSCSLPGEMEQCRALCHAVPSLHKTENGWNPWAPVVLASFQPALIVRSCDVHTVGGHMTLVCECEDPGLLT